MVYFSYIKLGQKKIKKNLEKNSQKKNVKSLSLKFQFYGNKNSI